MSNKYRVKNCPAISFAGGCQNEEMKGWNCQDCTNCAMKQIVELCRHYKKHSDCGRDCSSFGSFLNKLLDKLDIQEAE